MVYDKKTWVDGEYIYPEQLNHIEHGIKDLNDEYAPFEWASGDIISSVRLNRIEDGVYSLHDDYEKTNWQRNDIITAERLNHIEDNIYKISDHTITAVATNGTIPETTGWVIVGDVATKIVAEGEPYGDLPTPTRTGYTFTGWYTASTGGTEVTSETVMGDSDVSIYAQWQVETKTTVLYTDGTFIINEPASKRAANIQAHGAVTNEYDAWDGVNQTYDFFSAGTVLWKNVKSQVLSVKIGSVVRPVSTANWFYDFNSCTSFDFTNLDTSDTTDMSNMFRFCYKITNLNLSMFNTAKVITMQRMFDYCKLLSSVNVSSFNTNNVKNMSNMFGSCEVLTSLNLSNFTGNSLMYCIDMFYRCLALTSVNLSNFSTPIGFQQCNGMFYYCTSLSSLNLGMTNVPLNNDSMFAYCSSLTSLDLSKWITHGLNDCHSLFAECTNLRTIYVSENFLFDDSPEWNNMFYNCTSLVGGAGTAYNANYTNGERAKIDGGVGDEGYFTAAS